MDIHQLRRKQRRGRILRALDMVYPGDLPTKTLVMMLAEARLPADETKVSRDLAYLEDKDYVRLEVIDDMGDELHVARLTAHGKDLLEGNIIQDCGVTIEL